MLDAIFQIFPMKFFIRDLLLVTVIVAPNTMVPGPPHLQSVSASEPKVGKDAAFETWAGLKSKTDGEYRISLKRLGLDSREAIPVFVSKIGSDKSHIRKAAIRGLGLIGNQDVATALPALLQATKDIDPGVRRDAVTGLGAIGASPEIAVPAIVAVLEKDESYSAARALAKFGPKASSAIGSLTKAASYKEPLARASAAEALGKIGPAAHSATAVLRLRLKDEDDVVRGFAARAIWQIEGTASPELIDVLVELLKTREISIGLHALETLGDIGPPAKKALPALEAARMHEEGFFVAPAIWATGRIREEKDILPRLMLELKNEEPNARSSTAWALGKMGPEARDVVPALRELAFDPRIGFGRLVVVQALEEIDGKEKTANWIESMERYKK